MPGEDQNREDRTRERSLDELARGLASGTLSRRQALKLMGGALLGGVLAAALPFIARRDEQVQAQQQQGNAPCPSGTHPCPDGTCAPVGVLCVCPNCPPDMQCCPDGTCVVQGQTCGLTNAQTCPDCPSGTHCCPSGACVEPGEACPMGDQGCAVGEKRCNGSCVNVNCSANCGGCGNACPPELPYCAGGLCVPSPPKAAQLC